MVSLGSKALVTAMMVQMVCPGGGIGRRAGFRCQWPQGRGSSSLLLGTNLTNQTQSCRLPPTCWGGLAIGAFVIFTTHVIICTGTETQVSVKQC